MSSDRNWIRCSFDGMGGITDEYKRVVDNFVKFAQQTKDKFRLIECLCTNCKKYSLDQ